MCGPEDPLFMPLLPLARVLFQAKESVHKTPFWENLEILASTASIFTQILAHKPPNLEIFSSQAPKLGNFPLTSPPFQRQMSARKPHTSEIQAAHPYLKKSWVPPQGGIGSLFDPYVNAMWAVAILKVTYGDELMYLQICQLGAMTFADLFFLWRSSSEQ